MPFYRETPNKSPRVHDEFDDLLPDYGSIEEWTPGLPITVYSGDAIARSSSIETVLSDDTVTSGGTVREDAHPSPEQAIDRDISDSAATAHVDASQLLSASESHTSQPVMDVEKGKETSTANRGSTERASDSKIDTLVNVVARALSSIWNGEDREFFFTAYPNKGGTKEISIDINGKIVGKADSRFGYGFPFGEIDISDVERQALQEDHLEAGGKDFEYREALSLHCDTEGNEAPRLFSKA